MLNFVRMHSADPYMVAWRLRGPDDDAPSSGGRRRQLAEAEAVARALVKRFGARRVILVGGQDRDLLEGAVTLWVEGLPESACVEAANLVRESITGAEVELLRAEWAVAEVRERALREGLVLHAA